MIIIQNNKDKRTSVYYDQDFIWLFSSHNKMRWALRLTLFFCLIMYIYII